MSATAKTNRSTKKNRVTAPPGPVPGHEDIALCALAIWEAEGQPKGRDREHWLLAEARLSEHPSVPAGSVMNAQPRRSKQDSHR